MRINVARMQLMASRMVKMSLQHVLIIIILVIWHPQLVRAHYQDNNCPCPKWPGNITVTYISDYGSAGSEHRIYCCASSKPEYQNQHPTITWTFNGKPLNRSGLYFICGGEIIVIKELDASHEGNFTCSVTISNAIKPLFTTNLMHVVSEEEFREKPKEIKILPETTVYAKEGESVFFTCLALVGAGDHGSQGLMWMKVKNLDSNQNSVDIFPPNSNWNYIVHSNGSIKGYLEIKSVDKDHFGNYVCSVSNKYGSIQAIVTLIDGGTTGNFWSLSIMIAAVVGCLITLLLIVRSYGKLIWQASNQHHVRQEDKKARGSSRSNAGDGEKCIPNSEVSAPNNQLLVVNFGKIPPMV